MRKPATSPGQHVGVDGATAPAQRSAGTARRNFSGRLTYQNDPEKWRESTPELIKTISNPSDHAQCRESTPALFMDQSLQFMSYPML